MDACGGNPHQRVYHLEPGTGSGYGGLRTPCLTASFLALSRGVVPRGLWLDAQCEARGVAGGRGPRYSASWGTPCIIVPAGSCGEPLESRLAPLIPGRGGGGAARARPRGRGGLVTVQPGGHSEPAGQSGGAADEPRAREPPYCTLTLGPPSRLAGYQQAALGWIFNAGVYLRKSAAGTRFSSPSIHSTLHLGFLWGEHE